MRGMQSGAHEVPSPLKSAHLHAFVLNASKCVINAIISSVCVKIISNRLFT